MMPVDVDDMPPLRPADMLEQKRPSVYQRCLCWLSGGHDTLPHWGLDRIYLKCTTCGYETPGWLLAAPKVRAISTLAPVPTGEERMLAALVKGGYLERVEDVAERLGVRLW